jgi:hypothetical protein
MSPFLTIGASARIVDEEKKPGFTTILVPLMSFGYSSVLP